MIAFALVPAAGLAAAIALVVVGCDSRAEATATPPAPEVGLAAVLSESVRDWSGATGRIAAVQRMVAGWNGPEVDFDAVFAAAGWCRRKCARSSMS